MLHPTRVHGFIGFHGFAPKLLDHLESSFSCTCGGVKVDHFTNTALEEGRASIALDVRHHVGMDILTTEGFLQHVYQVCRLRAGDSGFLIRLYETCLLDWGLRFGGSIV